MSDSDSSFDMVRDLEMENPLNDAAVEPAIEPAVEPAIEPAVEPAIEPAEAFEQSYSDEPQDFLSNWRPQVPIFMTAQEVPQQPEENIDIPDVPDFLEQHDEVVSSIAVDVDVIPEAKK